jgi:nucleoside-diphosphate-sugar epimerase
MSDITTIIGFGPVGRAAATALQLQGKSVRIAQRHTPSDLPAGMVFQACDVLDAAAVHQAVAGASNIVLATGFDYSGSVWRLSWPRAMANVLTACAAHSARLVFVDNLYMYGPQSAPLVEDMPLTSFGEKPAVRAAITRQWMAEAQAGRVRVTALRAPDFYGPCVLQSHLGESGFARLAKDKRALLIAPPDTLHDFAYVPDLGRAVATLVDATDDCFNQAWHIPCAPIITPRQILKLGAQAGGKTAAISAIPLGLLPVIGLAVPFFRNLVEMRFQWDRTYRVDYRKFASRFWSDPTPFEIGAARSLQSFIS